MFRIYQLLEHGQKLFMESNDLNSLVIICELYNYEVSENNKTYKLVIVEVIKE